MDLALGFDRICGGRRFAEKVVDHIGHRRETVYAAQFAVDMFVAEPVAHGGARFNGVKLDALAVSSSAMLAKRVRTLHVHKRCRGKIEHYQFRRRRLDTNAAQDRIAYIVDVKVNEGRFRPENHHVQGSVRCLHADRNPRNGECREFVRGEQRGGAMKREPIAQVKSKLRA